MKKTMTTISMRMMVRVMHALMTTVAVDKPNKYLTTQIAVTTGS